MSTFFEKLRSKSKHEKRIIAAIISLLCTSVIFLMWVSSLPVRLGQIQNQETDSLLQFKTVIEGSQKVIGNATSAFTSFKSMFDVSTSK